MLLVCGRFIFDIFGCANTELTIQKNFLDTTQLDRGRRSKQSSSQVVEILTRVLHYSQRQESGVAKHCIALPWDPRDKKIVYVLKNTQTTSHSRGTKPAQRLLIS